VSFNQKAKELAEILKNTKEFSELKLAKSNIDLNKNLKIKIEDFKKKEQELFKLAKSGKDTKARAEELNKIFYTLSKIPEVDQFIKAEKQFNDNVVVKAYKAINDSIDSALKT